MEGAPQRAEAGAAILAALQARRRVAEKILILVAHPDDETIGMGAQLCRFDNALIVHATDGAPRDGADMARHGFCSLDEYAAARRAELMQALEAGGASALRTGAFYIADKEACRDMAGLTRRVADLLVAERPAAVFTHAYEGGHPDHDAVAFAVHTACRFSGVAAPSIIEMALYHGRDGRCVRGQFRESSSRCKRDPPKNEAASERRALHCSPCVLRDGASRLLRMTEAYGGVKKDRHPEVPRAARPRRTQGAGPSHSRNLAKLRRKLESCDPDPERLKRGSGPAPGRRFAGDAVLLPLDEADVERKRRMIDCFTTQRWLLAEFPLDCERLRIAPVYDFRAPPHQGVLHYETIGWDITGAEWRRYAAAALGELGLADLPCC